MSFYARPPRLVSVGHRSGFLFILPDREPTVVEGVDADALAGVLAVTGMPVSRAELEELCDGETIDRLVALGVLEIGTQEALANRYQRPAIQKRCKRITVALTGAIRTATFIGHVVSIADGLAEEVDVIVSEGAQEFIEPRLFSYYGMRVWTDAYEPAHGITVPHRHLAAADLVLVAPASATTIQRLASGACSDLTSLVVAITEAPVVVAPSMHPNMWAHPPIVRNIEQLRADGVYVIEPGVGFSVSDRAEREVGAATFEADDLLRVLDAVLQLQHADA